jgi:hypothetical protein
MLVPKLSLVAPESRDVGVSYYVPLLPALLAGGALLGWARPATEAGRTRRLRIFLIGFATMAAGAFVLMMGAELRWGEHGLKLPGYWAGRLLPGFEKLRAPFRWGLLIGLVVPVMAGVGLLRLEAGLARAHRGFGAGWPRAVLRAGLALLLALNLPLRPLEAKAAWEPDDPILDAHRVLAGLPRGPVLEVPWPIEPVPGSLYYPSRYILASTLHWQPMLGGFTGYRPRASVYLRRIAQRLPEQEAIEHLRRLSGLRWIVVHMQVLSPPERDRWERAAAAGRLRLVERRKSTLVLEVPDWEQGGDWSPALLARQARPETFTGLPRTALPATAGAGSLRCDVPGSFYFVGGELGRWSLPKPVQVELGNRSTLPWPGFDIQPEGLVRLRATFRTPSGAIALRDVFPIDVDVAPGERLSRTVLLNGPTERGRYRLELELVQQLEGGFRELGVPPVRLAAEVRPWVSR